MRCPKTKAICVMSCRHYCKKKRGRDSISDLKYRESLFLEAFSFLERAKSLILTARIKHEQKAEIFKHE